jgi:PiT family inorganic phosphate transporter
VGEIVSWWIVSPVVGFWLAAVVGRYWYRRIDRRVAIDRTEGPLLTVERAGPVPYPAVGPNTTRRELAGTAVVVGIGCLMAFSSGTSNVANAIAPLVGSGALDMERGIIIACIAVTVGAFTIARRTMETLGSDITDLPLTAAIVVAVLSSGIVVSLSAVGIPASFVVIATMCIVGLGWGRASRSVGLADAARGRDSPAVSVDALAEDPESPTVGDPAAEHSAERPAPADAEGEPSTAELFDPSTTFRVVAMQNVVPVFATVGSFLTFTLFF